MGKFSFDSLQKGSRTKDLPNGCGVDPDRAFETQPLEETHSLEQCLSEPFLKEASDQEIRGREDEKKGEEAVVEEIDHCE